MAVRASAFWTFIAVLILLHLTFRVGFGLAVVPDLLVVSALLGARRLGSAAAAGYGLALGILADSLSTVAFGATAVAFVVVCYLGSRSRNLFEGDSFLFILVYVFVGAWIAELIRFLVDGSVQRGEAWMSLLTMTPLLALYTGIAGFLSLLAYRAATGYR
jgi:rod shape-determining protein MreD